MPVPLLIALFLAFGTDAILPMAPVERGSAVPRAVEALGVVGLVGLSALGFSAAVVGRVRRNGGPTPGSRRLFAAGSRAVGALTLGGYGWILFGLNWPEVVRSGLGLRDALLGDELLILLPYVLALVAGWWGLWPADRAMHPGGAIGRPPSGVARHLTLKARQTLGLVLPAALIFSLGQDLARRAWPAWSDGPGFQLGMMATMGGLVLILASGVRPPELADPVDARRAAPRPPGTPGRPVRVPVHGHPGLGDRRDDRQRRGHRRPPLVPLRPADRRADRRARPARGGRRLRPRGRARPAPPPGVFRLSSSWGAWGP